VHFGAVSQPEPCRTRPLQDDFELEHIPVESRHRRSLGGSHAQPAQRTHSHSASCTDRPPFPIVYLRGARHCRPHPVGGRIGHGYCSRVDERALAATVASCKDLIDLRFPDDGDHGAAAMLLGDGTILTGTAPDAVNASVEVCHEIEPYCGAYRLNQRVVASVCLHRQLGGRTVVLSPCGVCRERLAVYGPGVLVAVADRSDPTVVVWKTLRDVLPDYWMTAFPDEIDAGWTT
jgi:cytidine deaminase